MNDAVPHYVNQEPFDPYSIEALTPEQEQFYMASQWKMIWWRLKEHRLAVVSGFILIFMYASILIVEILAPYELHTRNTDFIYAPPQAIHLFHDGSFEGPFVYGLDYRLNMEDLKREYTENRDKVDHLRFFCLGDSYSFWGLFDAVFT